MSKKLKEPKYIEAERCIELRKRSKRGEALTSEQLGFCYKMLKQYPEWYSNTEERVFNETVPFGSNVKWSDRK